MQKKKKQRPKIIEEENLFRNFESKEKKKDLYLKSEENINEKAEEKKVLFSPPIKKRNDNVLYYEIKKNLSNIVNNRKTAFSQLKIFEGFNKSIPNSSNKNEKEKFSYFSNEHFKSFINNNNTTTNSANYLNENKQKNFSLYNFAFYNSHLKKIFDNIDVKLEKVKTSLDEVKNLTVTNNKFSNSSLKFSGLVSPEYEKIINTDKNKSALSSLKISENSSFDKKPLIMQYKGNLEKIAFPDKKIFNNFLINQTTKELNPEALEMFKKNSKLKCTVSVMHNVKNSFQNIDRNLSFTPENNRDFKQEDDSKRSSNKNSKFKIKLLKNSCQIINKNSEYESHNIIKKPNNPEEIFFNKTHQNFFSQSPSKSKKNVFVSERNENEVLLSRINKENIYTQNNVFCNVSVTRGFKNNQTNICKLRNEHHDIDILTKNYIKSFRSKGPLDRNFINETKNSVVINKNHNSNSMKMIFYKDNNV